MTTKPVIPFSDAMTQIYLLWEQSEREMKLLQEALNVCEQQIKEVSTQKKELEDEKEQLVSKNDALSKEVEMLMTKLQEAEDYQKQFTKVSHILTMEREKTHLQQQLDIMERRVAFYRNQCKRSFSVEDQETQTMCHQQQEVQQPSSEADNNDVEMNVVEKKIKGVVYYLSDEGDIYEKTNEAVGKIRGKIEALPSGKTKVKWYK